MDSSSQVETGSSSDGAVDLRVMSRDDVTSGRPLDLTLSIVTETEEKSSRCDASTPPDTPTSPAAASAFKKTMLKRYSTHHFMSIVYDILLLDGPENTKKIPNWRKIQVLQFYRHCLQLGLARISQATNECMDEYGH